MIAPIQISKIALPVFIIELMPWYQNETWRN